MAQNCEEETEFSKNMKELQLLLADVNRELTPICQKCAIKKSSKFNIRDSTDEKYPSLNTETNIRLTAGDNQKKMKETLQNNIHINVDPLKTTEIEYAVEKIKTNEIIETSSNLELSKFSKSDVYQYIGLPTTSKPVPHKEENKILFKKKSPLNLLNLDFDLKIFRSHKHGNLGLVSSTASFEDRLKQIYRQQKEAEIYDLPPLPLYTALTDFNDINENQEQEADSEKGTMLVHKNKYYKENIKKVKDYEQSESELPEKPELRVGSRKTIDHEKLKNINENIETRWRTLFSPQARRRNSIINLYRSNQDRKHNERRKMRKQHNMEDNQSTDKAEELNLVELYVRNDKKIIQSVIENKTRKENRFKQMIEKYFSKHVPLKDLESNFNADYFLDRFVDNFDDDVYSGSDYDSQADDDDSFNDMSSHTNFGSIFSIDDLAESTTQNWLTALHNEYIEQAFKAQENGQIFYIQGHFGPLRKEMLRRGWLEKLPEERFSTLQELPDAVLLYNARKGNNYETAIISRILAKCPASFIWQPKFISQTTIERIGVIENDFYPHRNRVYRGYNIDFTSKIGLIGCIKEDTHASDRYPRVHRIFDSFRERESFVEDYRRTQCRSLLRYLCKHFSNSHKIIDERMGTIPASTAYFSLEIFKEEYYTVTKNSSSVFKKKTDDDWNNFITYSNKIIHSRCKLKMTLTMLTEIVNAVRPCLCALEGKTRNIKWEGYKNVWLLKPGFKCRGMGIIITKDMEFVLRAVTSKNRQSYIVQKYIELPLLIYNTKFDIRMYFIYRIEAEFITVWLYNDCYLRFSSQTFSLNDLQESIHLTNNSVQKKYLNSITRDKRLPACNMWSQLDFLKYLDSQDKYDLWKRQILPGVQAIIISIVTASLKDTELIQNTYELFGCDFMLDQDYHPVLIEINASPDLTHSTPVTAVVCSTVLADLVKVVLDYPTKKQNGSAFNLIHRFHYK